MRKMKVPANFVPLFFSIFLLALITSTQRSPAQTQAPAAGTTVVVKMVDAVDSGSDPGGKQYSASVAKPVTANGTSIAQGAAATVTLAKSGSGWTAQLSSVVIGGQPVAVTSSSASVTSAAQNALGGATNAMNSVLGGFGRPRNTPSVVTAVAMGQRVVLPPGTTLSFVLGQPPAASSNGATAPVAPAGQTMAASAAPASSPASSPAVASASGYVRNYRCYYRGQKPTHDLSAPADNQIVYVTPLTTSTRTPAFNGAPTYAPNQEFSAYMQANYDLSKILGGTFGCEVDLPANVPDSQEKQWAAAKVEVIHVNWIDTPAGNAAIAAHAASAATATATAAGGPFISCSTRGTQGVSIYVTGIFQTSLPIKQSPNGAKFVDQSVLDHFHAYLTQQGYQFTPGNNGGCDVSPTEAAAVTAQNTRIHGGGGGCGYCGFKVVETGWKDTPGSDAPPLHH